MIDNEISQTVPVKSSRKPKSPMPIKLDIPQPELMKPKITIFGVGGAGGNALNNMIRSNLEGVEFVAANTDSQALSHALTPDRIQLGARTTKGLGAGSFPDRGKMAAEENIEEIEKHLEGCNMVFIAAGMGGGTGTGAAPVIAKLAREREILTVGVVTKPFHFEGKYRMETAEAGIEELKKYVDTLIIIPNQNLFRIANENTTFESAFKMADDVLHAGVRGVTDLITMPGLVNLDFADIRTIMTKMGKAMMGTGEATGENRAILACEAAIANPLLDDISIKGAKGVLVNMTGGPDMTLFEADMAVNTIRKEVDQNANIIFGSAFDESMKGKIRISVVATGIDSEEFRRESFKSKETNEPSRFKAVVPETAKQNSSKSFFDPGVSAKPSKLDVEEISDENFKPKKIFSKEENLNYGKESENPTPRVDQENKQQASASNFFNETSSKTIPVAPAQLSTVQSKPQFQDEQEEEWHEEVAVKFEEKIVEKAPEPKKPVKPAKSTEKTKKDSGGFSLFSFMNNKEKTEENLLNSDNKVSGNIFSESERISVDLLEKNEEKTKKIKQISDQEAVVKISSQEAEKKRQQFFGNTIFDEEVGTVNQEEKFDDDIINVPAFFRRKK
jgi:cell division protein FtsZ